MKPCLSYLLLGRGQDTAQGYVTLGFKLELFAHASLNNSSYAAAVSPVH